MCGLFGGIMFQPTEQDVNVLKYLCVADSVRGYHSTGLAISRNGAAPTVVKEAVNGATFVELDVFKKALAGVAPLSAKSRTVQNLCVIGHNRWATVGDIDSKSAHPFNQGEITGAHNGTLYWHQHLEDDDVTFDVDSEAIMYALSKQLPKDVLEQLPGAYALTWIDARDGTLNMARNNERPLWIATLKDGSIFWCSEKYMLLWAISKAFKTDDPETLVESLAPLPLNTVVRIELNTMEYLPEIYFTPEKQVDYGAGEWSKSGWGNRSGYGGYGGYGGSYDYDYYPRGQRSKKDKEVTKDGVSGLTSAQFLNGWLGQKDIDVPLTGVFTAGKFYRFDTAASNASISGHAVGTILYTDGTEMEAKVIMTIKEFEKGAKYNVQCVKSAHCHGAGTFAVASFPTRVVEAALPDDSSLMPLSEMGELEMKNNGCSWCQVHDTTSAAREYKNGTAVLCGDCVAEINSLNGLEKVV